MDSETGIADAALTSPAPPRGAPLSRIAQILCVVAVLAVYSHASISYGKTITGEGYDFHSQIADAFLAGQVNLDIPVPKGLLELEDPYDAQQNSEYRTSIHDLSLYEGKLYAYFGPAPALLLYIPAQAFGVRVSSALAALVFVSLGFLFSVLAFRFLVRRFFKPLPSWLHCGAILSLGLGIPAAWIIHIGRGYEVSIACGYFLVFAGLYLLARGLFDPSRFRLGLLALGSLALGLTVAARPSLLGTGILIAGALAWVWRERSSARRAAAVAAIVAPFVAVGAALALYNYARFGSFIEFGESFQLLAENTKTYIYWRPSYLPRAIYYYLLSPPRIASESPYLFLRQNTYVPGVYSNEPVVGIFPAMPLVPVAIVLGLTQMRTLWNKAPRTLVMIIAIGLVGVFALVVPGYRIRGTTMRYELDFAPIFLFVGLLGTAAWWAAEPRRVWRVVGVSALGLAVIASIAFNLAIISTPCAGTGSC